MSVVEPSARATVLVVADPGLPHELAGRLRDELQREVSVLRRRLPADEGGEIRLPDDVVLEDGQVAVLLTDAPRRDGVRPIVAEVQPAARAGLVSLPSLGGIRVRARATQAVERVVDELCGDGDGGDLGPFVRERGDTVRFVTAGRHGRLRILAGMVRANRPWRLVPHLSKAFAAALGVLAYSILNPTIWQLGQALGAWRLLLAMVVAISCMVGWLVVNHELWERPDDAGGRELARLFNVATLVTLLIGVLLLYLGLLVLGFVADRIVVDSDVMSSATGAPASLGQHLAVVWLVASIATVAGAVGTGFETDDAVRQAAYGYRHRERVEGGTHDRDRDDDLGLPDQGTPP